ncbi:KR domain-containing protein [Nonomuraea sp. NPDC004297]
MSAGTFAVAGATGRLGRHVVEVLAERGARVVPMSRATGVDVVTGEGLAGALAGAEVVIDVASWHSSDQDAATEFFRASARHLHEYGRKAGGDAMIAAAQATLGQMKGVWPAKTDAQLRRMFGVIPMIGKNDTGMTTTQADARKLLAWANTNHIGFVGFWSAARDNGGCPDGRVSPTCSGIAQSNYEFTGVFKGFTG